MENLNYHLSAPLLSKQFILPFDTGSAELGNIVIFSDLSVLLYAEINSGDAFICTTPLKLRSRYDFKEHDPRYNAEEFLVIFREFRDTSFGCMIGAYSSTNNIANLGRFYAFPQNAPQTGANLIHSQILNEARWWLANAPVSTISKPPFSATFSKASPNMIEHLHARLRHAAIIASISGQYKEHLDIGEVKLLVYSPLVKNLKGGVTNIQVHVRSNYPKVVADRLSEHLTILINTDPTIDPNDYVGQNVTNEKILPKHLMTINGFHHITAHEQIDAAYAILNKKEPFIFD